MDAVKGFLQKHDKAGSTEVCTETAAPVTQEHVNQHQKTEVTEAHDREIHQHHHQHRVQPVAHTETLATEHEHVMAPEVTKEHIEDMRPEHKEKLHQMHTQHKDSRTVGETEHTQVHAGHEVNEHVHHHVHEHVTPVIQKETHAHKTVHTTVPVHEKIHEAPIVHETTVLPTVSMDQFKDKLSGSGHEHGDQSHQHKFFGGEPKVAGVGGAGTHAVPGQNTSAAEAGGVPAQPRQV